jgi:ABC-type Fe3+ transport system substrate-binding protein
VEIVSCPLIHVHALCSNAPSTVKAFPDLIINFFQNRFPDIKLNLTGDLSKYLDSKIDIAYQLSQDKDNGADVAVLQTLHDFPRWKAQSRLMPYKVASWNDIYPEFVDPDGAYTGIFVGK